AAIYPIVVLSVAVLIVAGIMVFVVPSFKKMFDDLNVTLPTVTLILLDIAKIVQDFWWLIPIIPVVLYIAIKAMARSKGGRGFMDNMKLKLPIMGSVMKKAVIARFSRTLATLIASGVPILDALSIVKEATGNKVIEDAIEKVHGSIKEGETIAGPLAQCKVFDDIFINMIDVGEETGALDKMLSKIADNYEEEVDVAVESMTSLLEPVLIVSLGATVGFIVISLFMPLVKIIQTFGQ
ncbi:MAG: type II secretion system F family protein, partial [Planctomycetota bacterium]